MGDVSLFWPGINNDKVGNWDIFDGGISVSKAEKGSELELVEGTDEDIATWVVWLNDAEFRWGKLLNELKELAVVEAVGSSNIEIKSLCVMVGKDEELLLLLLLLFLFSGFANKSNDWVGWEISPNRLDDNDAELYLLGVLVVVIVVVVVGTLGMVWNEAKGSELFVFVVSNWSNDEKEFFENWFWGCDCNGCCEDDNCDGNGSESGREAKGSKIFPEEEGLLVSKEEKRLSLKVLIFLSGDISWDGGNE